MTHAKDRKMITKKTVIDGREFTQVFTSPLSLLHDFFDTSHIEEKTIRAHTEEHREFRKKIVSEGRLTSWGAIQPAKEKVRR
jgi:hypothetical protein